MDPSTRPLVVTADGALLDEVLGVAGAAGVAVDVAVDPAAAGPQWTAAPFVLLDREAMPAASRLPRRSDVLLVTLGPVGDDRGAAGDVLCLPGDEEILLARLSAVAEPDRATTAIAVIGGRGGAGTSTLAAALALVAAGRSDTAWLVDLDPLGGGADAVLGAELAPGARWSDLDGTEGRVSVRALREATPTALGVPVLSCDGGPPDGPDAGTTRAVLTAIARGGGTVVLDLPRHPTPAREQALALTDRLVAVVPADVRAVLAARRVLAALERVPPRTELVVRAAHPGLPAVEVSRALGLPLAGVFADDQSVRAAGATGAAEDLLTGALERLCGDVLAGPADTRRAA